jgi:hypothetical protein
MKLGLDPLDTSAHVNDESLGLAAWYDSRPAVRRLWGIRDANVLRVIVMIEATHDNSDVLPVWLACSHAWAQELRVHTGVAVELELLDEVSTSGVEIEAGGVVIADLFWRDATLNQPNEVL